jgi:hypothetical protein
MDLIEEIARASAFDEVFVRLDERVAELPRTAATWEEAVLVSHDHWEAHYNELCEGHVNQSRNAGLYDEPASWCEVSPLLSELEQRLKFKALHIPYWTVQYTPKGMDTPVFDGIQKIKAPVRTIVTNHLALLVHELCHLMTASERDTRSINYRLSYHQHAFCHVLPQEWLNLSAIADDNIYVMNAWRRQKHEENSPTIAHHKEMIATVLEQELYAMVCPELVSEYGRRTYFEALHRGHVEFLENELIDRRLLRNTELGDMPDVLRNPVEKALKKHAETIGVLVKLLGHVIRLEGLGDSCHEVAHGR